VPLSDAVRLQVLECYRLGTKVYDIPGVIKRFFPKDVRAQRLTRKDVRNLLFRHVNGQYAVKDADSVAAYVLAQKECSPQDAEVVVRGTAGRPCCRNGAVCSTQMDEAPCCFGGASLTAACGCGHLQLCRSCGAADWMLEPGPLPLGSIDASRCGQETSWRKPGRDPDTIVPILPSVPDCFLLALQTPAQAEEFRRYAGGTLYIDDTHSTSRHRLRLVGHRTLPRCRRRW
jgi:hypothetical protein